MEILSEYHRRGISRETKPEAFEDLWRRDSNTSVQSHIDVPVETFPVKNIRHPAVRPLDEVLKHEEEQYKDETGQDEPVVQVTPSVRRTKTVSGQNVDEIFYDLDQIEKDAIELTHAKSWEGFAKKILEKGYLFALADGSLDWRINEDKFKGKGFNFKDIKHELMLFLDKDGRVSPDFQGLSEKFKQKYRSTHTSRQLLELENIIKDCQKRERIENHVLAAARELDYDLPAIFLTLHYHYMQPTNKLSVLHLNILELRRFFAKHKVALFFKRINIQRKYTYYAVKSDSMLYTKHFGSGELRFINEDLPYYKKAELSASVVKGGSGENGLLAYFEGQFAYAFKESIKEAARLRNLEGLTEEMCLWALYHELGHVLDKERLLARGIKIPPDTLWSKLAAEINKKGIGLWLSPNVELNSMLFPILFANHRQDYIIHELIYILRNNKDPKDAYVQAAKGILNGFLLFFYENNMMRDVGFLSDQFEDKILDALTTHFNLYFDSKFDAQIASDPKTFEVDFLKTAEGRLALIAREMYLNPKKYLSTTGAGVYRKKGVIISAGDQIEDVVSGDLPVPDMEFTDSNIIEIDETHIETPLAQEGRAETIDDSEPKHGTEVGGDDQEEDQPKDQEAEGKKGEDAKQSPDSEDQKAQDKDKEAKEKPSNKKSGIFIDESDKVSNEVLDIIEELKAIHPKSVEEFLKVFASKPVEKRIYDDEGNEFDIEKLASHDPEVLYNTKIEENEGELATGVTVDVSPSTRGELRNKFLKMVRFYTSLYHYAALRNPKMAFSLGAIGNNYHLIMDFSSSTQRSAVELSWSQIEKIKDSVGINTVALLEGIEIKYKSSMGKKNKLEIVLTDGGETSGKSPEELKKMVKELEQRLGIDIVFIGINSPKVAEYYPTYLNINRMPSAAEMMEIIMRLSLEKNTSGKIEPGDLDKKLFNGVFSRGKGDKAGLSKPGGVDLTPAHWSVQTQNQGDPIKFHIDHAMLARLQNAPGFVPVIISIHPMRDLRGFLGMPTIKKHM